MMEPGRLDRALAATRAHLLAARSADGFWEGRLSSSPLATATAVSALCAAGRDSDRPLVARGVEWLGQTQNADGGWGDTPESPSNLSTTLLAVSALRMSTQAAGDPPPASAEEYLARHAGATARDRVAAIRALYGADRTFAVPILMNCALAGVVPWREVPGLPFELAVLPRGFYRSVRLEVVSYALPALIAVGMVVERRNPSANLVTRGLRGLLRGRVLAKLRAIQPESGGFLEATPLTAFVAMSLAEAVGPEEPALEMALGFLRASAREDGSWPIDTNLAVWVTSGALNALGAGEGDRGDPATAAARRWLARRQLQHQHPYTGAAPGGWGWSYLSGSVPDADDTAGAILALAGTEEGQGVPAGVDWLLKLQNADGGWPTFCRGWGKLPFDQSCADITAHALRALHAAGQAGYAPARAQAATARGVAYLHRSQRPDGSWLPLWFGNQAAEPKTNPTIGTARVLMALALLEPEGEAAGKGLERLAATQNQDGGWGGSGGVASTVEETALAVSALSQWPEKMNWPLAAGVAYLVRRVEDGTWTQSAPLGLYFARLWYDEKLYPVLWTVEALNRARRCLCA